MGTALGQVVDDHVHELELVRRQGRALAGSELVERALGGVTLQADQGAHEQAEATR